MVRLRETIMPVPILFVIGSLNVGGAEKHLLQVLPRLDRKRWRPAVFCLTERGPLAEQLEASGVPVIGSSSGLPTAAHKLRRLANICASTWRLSRFMRDFRPTIVHFFLPAAYILGAPVSLLARIQIRIMSRRSLNDYQKGHRFLPLAERTLHPAMQAILGNSRSVVRQLHEQEGISRDCLGLIYNGIDLQPFASDDIRSSTRRRLGVPEDAVVFIIVANLIPYKGHGDLLAAFGIAKTRLPRNWRLLVVGRDDGIGADLEALATRLQIEENVLFLGARKDVAELLRAADIGILSSHQEGFSNAILEGMAAGLPMIVTNVGGNPEAVVDQETGLVVEPGNPAQFAAAIERLAGDPQLRQSLGMKAKIRIQQEFTLEACVARYEQLYEALMQGKRPAELAEIGLP
jgi:glycosyltransferase involved in cell wall biosynthesis